MNEVYISVLRSNPCPYAPVCRYNLSTVWESPSFSRGHISRLATELKRFALGGDEDVQDVFVVAIEGSRNLNLASATRMFRDVLMSLRSMDSLTQEHLTLGIEDDSWDFMFEGVAFFVMLLAPFYPTSHSRHSDLSDTTFIVFHPERTFRRFGISSKRHDRRELSEKIAALFSLRGRPYRLYDVCELAKPYRYVKPVSADDAPVAWWEMTVDPPN
jgi:hypothetical protein